MVARVDGRVVERTQRCQGPDPACGVLRLDGLLAELGIKQGDLGTDAEFARDLNRDVTGPVDVHVTPSLPAGADDDRDARLGRSAHQDGEVALDRSPVILGDAEREIGGTAVGRPRVGGDDVRPLFDPVVHLLLARVRPKRTGGHEDVDRPFQRSTRHDHSPEIVWCTGNRSAVPGSCGFTG